MGFNAFRAGTRMLAAAGLLLAAGVASAQVTVNLTVSRQSTLLPDGNTVPMWGWTCGAVSGPAGASCTATNRNAQSGAVATGYAPGGGSWQPPLITVPTGQSLTINLTNKLPVETSLTIVGQIPFGGLGTPVREAQPRMHQPQTSTTWPAATTPSQPFTPPGQGERVRSFVAEASAGGTQTYTWVNSGGTALKPGTYLIETGTYPSIQGPMGLYGVLVVTTAPGAGTAGQAYKGVNYDVDVALLLSEIDPNQNTAADAAAALSGFDETKPYTPNCALPPIGNNTAPTGSNACYPAAVNYSPLYYLINGISFDLTQLPLSQYPVAAAATSRNVLLRLVNAGLRMHVPSVVGAPMQIYAQDGNVEPDVALAISKGITAKPKTQSDVFMAAGKVYDVIVNPATTTTGSGATATTTYNAATLPIFDRQLSLSTNNLRDGGMRAYLVVAGGGTTGGPAQTMPSVVNDSFIVPVGAPTYSGNVLLNDIGIHNAASASSCTTSTGPQTITSAGSNAVTLNPNGSFTFTVPAGFSGSDTFQYCGNGNSGLVATVTLTAAKVGGVPTANADTFTTNIASVDIQTAPGVLANDTDPTGYPLSAVLVSNPGSGSGFNVNLHADGSFIATATAAGTYTFCYQAVNSQGTKSAPPAGTTGCPTGATPASVTFLAGSGLKVTVQDANPANHAPISDYKWIIEQDLTFYIDPACQQNGAGGTKPATCPPGIPLTLGTNFATSYMPVIAVGCTGPQSCERGQTVYDNNPASSTYGQHVPATCESGICTAAAAGSYLPVSTPDQVNLSGYKNPDGSPARFYISILPGDAANAFNTGNVSDPAAGCVTDGSATEATGQALASNCGHTMGGASIAPGQSAVTVNVEANPMKTAQVTIFVFEDDFPLNGEYDTGGNGQEPGLGDFQAEIWDNMSQFGDFTGQMTYDNFNEPLSNALAGTMDPQNGNDACPIAKNQAGVAIGVIIVCPEFESDGVTPSPLTGQAVVKNMMPGLYSVVIHPGAAREARGEEWLETNTLDGTHYLDSFIRSGEPAYFQEWGPGGFHVFMGMANPKLINARLALICNAAGSNPCNNTVTGQLTNLHEQRPPNEYNYDSNVFGLGDPRNNVALGHTQCYASLGDPDGEDFAFAKCDENGNYTFKNIPAGNWALKVFDQWLDLILDGSSKPVNIPLVAGGTTVSVDYATFSWMTQIWMNTFMDINGDGIQEAGEPGLIQVPSRVRMRDGRFSNTQLSDGSGWSKFNEVFPLFYWYVVESDTTRFKGTGIHVVYDTGGQLDGPCTSTSGTPPCPIVGSGNGKDTPYDALLNSIENFPLPPALRFPGSVYCAKADCTDVNLATNPTGGGPGGSTGRIDPGSVLSEGLQGFLSQTEVLEWGKQPYAAGENGGIRGHVVYASTRPFDDPSLLFQNLWEPLVPRVTVNLYQESIGPDGTTTLKLVDTTQTSSWDDWAQGFRADGVTPNMSCPGQDSTDPYVGYTLKDTRNYLSPNTPLPIHSQFKCYDGMHNFNQVQPAPYDGMYQFPSAAYIAAHPLTNPAPGQTLVSFPSGKYVVEVIPPAGFEIVKEEDKNILIGDAYIAPVQQQFSAISNIFIVPDQAVVNAYANPSYTGPYTGDSYNPPLSCSDPNTCTTTNVTTNNGNPTTNMDRLQTSGFGPGGLTVQNTPCVGQMRVVPDYMSISPESGQVSPFAGAVRPLCDRKEVTLDDQMQGVAEFFIWTKTPAASRFVGFILDDFSSEFDAAAPDFGEKFALPNIPVSFKDFNGVEMGRIYSDQWGMFDGLVYSTWQVNTPNPTGYSPNMMITCMNDPGPVPDPTGAIDPLTGQVRMITDPLFNPSYSDFCYEWPFMPADTAYMDTPVVPVAAFAEGYNPPDCNYPDATPGISSVLGDSIAANSASGTSGPGAGPWVSTAGNKLTINALGDQVVPNNTYSGPAATTLPFNEKFITRHYGFGTQCTTPTAGSPTCNTTSSVTIAGVSASVVSWSDTKIVVNAPSLTTAQSACTLTQRTTPASLGQSARCGQLVITAGNGKQSIDTVTVTIGGKQPTYVNGENTGGNAVQAALDAATPGDMIIVGPGRYNEMLLMWKPVRLQGIAAASTIIDANTHPAGKLLEPWRRQVNCLFGLTLQGAYMVDPTTGKTQQYDPTGKYTCPAAMNAQIDGIPLESLVGWDASLNGNIAELLQEPTLLGAYEGAAITVLAKGMAVADYSGGEGADLVTPVTGSNADCRKWGSDFWCNPSRIDGMSFTNSSQGGGGVFAHGWNHYLEISNNRVFGNAGTLTGGITLGQTQGPDPTFDASGLVQQPYALNQYVYMHNNAVTKNASYGDELNSNTPASAGGVTLCDGSDYYNFSYNWVCGNMSSGDGGGMAHYGFSYNGLIGHNAFLFNQSTNPTLPTWGGGLIVQGSAPDGMTGSPPAECGSVTDVDCAPGLSDGVGPGNRIDANLFVGNTAESGSGGGLRLQYVNGSDVQRSPLDPTNWYSIAVTNNIIANNVAGWAGGGVSIQDAVKVSFINNTVVSNDTTATAGVLFDTIVAPNGNVAPPGCDPNSGTGCTNPVTGHGTGGTQSSSFEPAGLETHIHTGLLSAVMNPAVICPAGHPQCTEFSNPVLDNNLFWQNRTFRVTVGNPPFPVILLAPMLNQTATGQCPSGATYWDIGVYSDGAPDSSTGYAVNNHASGFTLNPRYSILGDTGYGSLNMAVAPKLASQYCNGSRVPPEIAPTLCTTTNTSQTGAAQGPAQAPGCTQPGQVGVGITVPAGVPDFNPEPVDPFFSLTPAATIDEGNNWINMRYGPLSLVNDVNGNGALLGNWTPNAGSPAIDAIPQGTAEFNEAPKTDFFGNARPDTGNRRAVDIGAIEIVQVAGTPAITVNPTSEAFNNVPVGSTSAAQTVTVTSSGSAPLVVNGITLTGTNPGQFAETSNCPIGGIGLPVGSSCTISVTFKPTSTGAKSANLRIADTAAGSPQLVGLTGTGTQAAVSFAESGLTTSTANRTVKNGAITVTNSGTAPLTLAATNPFSVLQTSGSGAFIAPGGTQATTCTAGLVIQPGNSCTIGVQYTPPPTGGMQSGARVTLQDSGAATATQTFNFTAN